MPSEISATCSSPGFDHCCAVSDFRLTRFGPVSGVGHDVAGWIAGWVDDEPESLPLMAGADVGRADTRPFNITIDRGQRGQDSCECPAISESKEPCGVFSEHVVGS
jgi:hypothetical protein